VISILFVLYLVDELVTQSSKPPSEAKVLAAEEQRDIKDLARGGFITFVGKIGRASRGAFIWVITLLMGVDVLGNYSLAWGIVSILNKIARFGMQRGVVRFVVEGRSQGGVEAERAIATALATVGLCAVVVTGCVYFSADAIAAFYDKPIAPALRIMAFSAPFMAICWVLVSSIRALRIVLYDVYVMSVAGPLILLLGGLLAGWLDTGLVGVAWVQLGMAVGICFLAGYFFSRFFSLRSCLAQFSASLRWREMGHFSFPVMVTDLLYAVLTQLDVLMLGFFVSAELVGIYTLARRIASAMLKAPQAFDPIFSSIVSELALAERYDELSARFRVLFRWVLTINLPIFASLLIVGDLLLTLIGGDKMQALPEVEVAAGLKVLFVLSISMMLQGSFALAEPLLAMAGRPYLNFANNIVWLCANFVFNLIFIHFYSFGILGAAFGAVLATLIVNGLRLVQIRSQYGIWPFDAKQLKPLAAALIAGLGGWWVRDWITGALWAAVLTLAVFTCLYVSVLFFAGMEDDDRQLVGKGRRWLKKRFIRS
jgi:O-antigen/teichoic acid export membrane protein